MRRRISFLLSILLLLPLLAPAASATEVPGVSAGSYILIEANTGTVLAERDADAQMLIASTTKIMTALLVLESCDIDDTVKIRPEYTGVEGSSMYLKAGEELTVEELLYGLMLSSGNDAAVALACHTAGSIEDFADLMNERAEALGMTGSHFVNPHGLDADGHYSTARDMAKLTAEAVKSARFIDIVSTRSIQVAGRSLVNHNKLLWRYQGTLGVKTGYTQSAGRSLVSCAEREGTRLICVTLSAPDDWSDHEALYDWGFATCRYHHVVSRGDVYANIPVISGVLDSVDLAAEEEITLLVGPDDQVEVEAKVPRFAYAAVVAGEAAGSLHVKVNGEPVAETRLLYIQSIDQDTAVRLNFFERIRWSWSRFSGGWLGERS